MEHLEKWITQGDDENIEHLEEVDIVRIPAGFYDRIKLLRSLEEAEVIKPMHEIFDTAIDVVVSAKLDEIRTMLIQAGFIRHSNPDDELYYRVRA